MKPPIQVIIASGLFIIAGISGIIYHFSELKNIGKDVDAFWVLAVRVLAIIGGVFALRGAAWARWLLVAWIAYHVILSFFHSTAEIAMHATIMIIVIALLFNRKANAYFSR